jgi:acyl carrier protein
MDEKKFIENVVSIFDDVDVNTVNMLTNFREIDEWSSLAALVLLSVMEDEYGVALNNKELTGAKTVKDIFDLVRNKQS